MDGMCAKKQKSKGGTEPGEKIDRISELPDNLLHHIISLIPTRNAVATSVLSKMWKNLWIWVFNINIICIGKYRKGKIWKIDAFMDFVKTVLQLHRSNVKIFNLAFDERIDDSHVHSWISAAVSRQVQELSLSFRTENPVVLPQSLCTSKVLAALRLYLNCELKLPESVCFSNLKILQLFDVKFSDDALTEKLFNGLPMVEELVISGCDWNHIKSVTFSIPSLKLLTLYLVRYNYLCHNHEIKFYAENLTILSCVSDLTLDLDLKNLPLLVDAYINFQHYEVDEFCGPFAINHFNSVRFTKSLRLGHQFFEGFLDIMNYYETETEALLPTTFNNLTDLEVNCVLTQHTSYIFKYFLRCFPILKTLSIKKVYGGTWLRKESPDSPPFVMSSLKTCSMWFFSGHAIEMNFLKFILISSTELERIELHCSKFLTAKQERFEGIRKQMESIPGGLGSCVIEFFFGF